MLFFLRQLFRREDGQGLVEYGLIIALVALVVVGLLTQLGDTLWDKFNEIIEALTNPGGTGT
ncbi:MAG: Flp family type IVb pilin [Firmicutes bacterium]|nr:Flp family type IVb pilin [Bacillota bacterium]